MAINRTASINRNYRGVSLIWTMIFLMLLLLIGGLMIDCARVYFTSHQLQNAADASALAGAKYVALADATEARAMARDFAYANYAANVSVTIPDLNSANIATGDIVVGRYINPNETYPNGFFDPTDEFPDAMKVITRKDNKANEPLPLLFGSALGNMFGKAINPANIQRYAIAKIYDPYGSGLIALAENGIGVQIDGNNPKAPQIQVLNGGSIQVNSFADDAFFVNNKNITIGADRVFIVGDHNDKFSPSETTDVYTDLGADGVVPDPYAGVFDELSYAGLVDKGSISVGGSAETPVEYYPGYYSGGIVKPNGYVYLHAGVYHLGGAGFDATSTTTHIIGDEAGTLFHIVEQGSVDLNGGVVELTGHPDYQGIAIFQDNDKPSEIIGNNDLDINGVVYMPNSLLELGGTGDGFGTRAVAERYLLHGDAEIVINYKGTPKVAESSYLVE